jgi:hypothetical protein
MSTSQKVPPPPSLPEPPPAKLQFNIKHLLVFMTVAAVLATGLRYLLLFFERLPDNQATGLVATTLTSLAVGGMVYFLVRGPLLTRAFWRLAGRWRAVKAHRRDLEAWADARRREKGHIMEAEAPPPPAP